MGLAGDVLTPTQVLAPIPDPEDLAVSPDGSTVVVTKREIRAPW